MSQASEIRGEGGSVYRGAHAWWYCMTQLHVVWHVAVLSTTWHLQQILLDSCVYTVFYLLLQGCFWEPFGVQNGSCMVPLESLRSLLSNNIKFAQIRAWTEKLWLPKVGASELFFCIFSTKIPAKWEMLPTNRELHVIAGVAIFLKVLNLWINS